MGFPKSKGAILVSILISLLSLNYMPCKAQLSTTFYDTTCPNALSTIQSSVSAAVSSNRRNAALLIRLHFHDCFVQVMILFHAWWFCLIIRNNNNNNNDISQVV